jgi:phosphotransferase system enzyme I (PtsI)
MVEVPAAALQARWLLEHATFASLGTNDLTQYAMAADRELGALAELSTSWQPAVLRLVQATCEGAHIAERAHEDDRAPAGGIVAGTRERPVGVCGEAAGDPALAPVLVGLGVTSLSMAPAALGDVAAVLASTTMERCRQLARIALGSRDARAARKAVRAALPELDALGL